MTKELLKRIFGSYATAAREAKERGFSVTQGTLQVMDDPLPKNYEIIFKTIGRERLVRSLEELGFDVVLTEKKLVV